MNYDEQWLLSLIRKQDSRITALESQVGFLARAIAGNFGIGGTILRDEPTLPTEPPPSNQSIVWLLFFRNNAPGLIWDNINHTWL